MRQLLFIVLLITGGYAPVAAQGPWENDIILCTSTNGTVFDQCRVLVDSAGVPSAALDSTGRLWVVFQWFPGGPGSGTPGFDRVAQVFSDDLGLTWTMPDTLAFTNLAQGQQRPFDPTLVAEPAGGFRLYYSSSPTMPMFGQDSIIDTYSAQSSDGYTYTQDAGVRYSDPTRKVIDPAATWLNGTMIYTAPVGAPQDGAHHATSTNGIAFTPAAPVPSDNQHNWTGNLMVTHAGALRFYGTGSMGGGMWYAESPDGGNSWNPYVPVQAPLPGGDPTAIQLADSAWVIVFVGKGELLPVGRAESTGVANGLTIYPNPATQIAYVSTPNAAVNSRITVSDATGRTVLNVPTEVSLTPLPLDGLAPGVYAVQSAGRVGRLVVQ